MSKRDRVCGEKAKHTSRKGAEIEAKKALRAGMNVYYCPKCRHWHIGKSRSPIRASDRITALLERHAQRLQQRTTNEHAT